MTEKQYGGATSFGAREAKIPQQKEQLQKAKEKTKDKEEENLEMSQDSIEKIKKAGEIARITKEYARSIIKKDVLLLEIAEKIESKIIEFGGVPAFPVNLSINEVAAHSTPTFNDSSLAYGLLKVDLGVHIDGFVADTAFSLDLDDNSENKKLIESSELALKKAIEIFSRDCKIREVGKEIQKTAESYNFKAVANLSGHSITQYNLHAGVTVPNVDNSQEKKFEEGLYAIEPFTTNGLGSVRDGKPSGIYQLQKEGNVRDSFAREVLSYITEEYGTLPFCARWIYKKFSSRGLLALRRIEETGILYQYAQLIESGKGKVAQSEHTVILLKKEKIITT